MKRKTLLLGFTLLILLSGMSCWLDFVYCGIRGGTWKEPKVKPGEEGYFKPCCSPFDSWCSQTASNYRTLEEEPANLPDQPEVQFSADAEEPANSAGAMDSAATEGYGLRLIPTDVRKVQTPPDVIAYANIDYTPPPDNVIIKSSGDLWTYNANIALTEKGEWISATCTDPNTTAIGVRIEGDSNDGYVLIQVDGEEAAIINAYGDEDSPQGMFLNYVEMSGLQPGQHTIRLENLGMEGDGGGDDVSMRFFGCSSKPVSEN